MLENNNEDYKYKNKKGDFMNNIKFLFKMMLLIAISIIVKCIRRIKEKSRTINDLKIVEFPSIYKSNSFLALFIGIGLVVNAYKNNEIVDMLIMPPLLILFIFAILYFCGIKIIINPNLEYFIFRNILFIKKKIYYCDISYAQIKKNTLYIFLKNGRKKWLIWKLLELNCCFLHLEKIKLQ